MKRISIATITAAGAALVPRWVWAQGVSEADRYFYGPHMGWGGGWYSMFFGPLMMILVLAAVIAAMVFLARGSSGQAVTPPHYASPVRTPLDILKERFARGDIDKNELEDRRRALGE